MGEPCYCAPGYTCASCRGWRLPSLFSRPGSTVLTMGPETETGEDACGVELRWVCMEYDSAGYEYWEPVCADVEDWLNGPPGIPAPTPRAP